MTRFLCKKKNLKINTSIYVFEAISHFPPKTFEFGIDLLTSYYANFMQIYANWETRERERGGERLRSTDVSFFLYHNVEEAKTRTRREIRKCGSPGCNCRCELCQDGVWNWADASERASSIQRMDVVIELIGLHLKFQNINYRIWRLKCCCIRRRVMTSQGGGATTVLSLTSRQGGVTSRW